LRCEGEGHDDDEGEDVAVTMNTKSRWCHPWLIGGKPTEMDGGLVPESRFTPEMRAELLERFGENDLRLLPPDAGDSSSYSAADGFSSAVSQYAISS
jgi:hypothetical protein